MTYVQLNNLMNNAEVGERIFAAALAYCITVQAESGATAGHTLRLAFARSAMNNPTAFRERLIRAAVAAMAANSFGVVTDAQIDTAVAACWNTLSGV